MPVCCRLQPSVCRAGAGSAKRIATRSGEWKELLLQGTLRRPLRALDAAAAIAAIAAPAASAAPVEQFVPSARDDASERVTPVRVVQALVDAGIGASGLLALMAIGAGAAVATGRRVSIGHDPHAVR